MQLARAIGKVITDITGAYTFGDDAANTKFRYPCFEVATVDRDERMIRKYYEKDGSGNYQYKCKDYKGEALVRIAGKAVTDNTGSAEANTRKLMNALKDAIDEIVDGDTVYQFIDPVTSEDQKISRMKMAGNTPPALDQSGEPFFYVATQELEIRFSRKWRSAAPEVIDKVTIEHEVRHEV